MILISFISARAKLFFQNLIEDELAAILKKKKKTLGDYRLILASSSTNQHREFSKITYAIILKLNIDNYIIYTIIIYHTIPISFAYHILATQ